MKKQERTVSEARDESTGDTVVIVETESGFKATRKRAIVVPVYSFKKRETGFFLVEEAIKLKTHKDDKGDDKQTPVMRIVDCETGEVCDMIVPTLLVSELNENFPDDGYVGKKFEVNVSKDVAEGKRYKRVKLWEID